MLIIIYSSNAIQHCAWSWVLHYSNAFGSGGMSLLPLCWCFPSNAAGAQQQTTQRDVTRHCYQKVARTSPISRYQLVDRLISGNDVFWADLYAWANSYPLFWQPNQWRRERHCETLFYSIFSCCCSPAWPARLRGIPDCMRLKHILNTFYLTKKTRWH